MNDGVLGQPTTPQWVTLRAGLDVRASRPATTGPVYWVFDAGVNPGAGGVNIVNAKPGDLYFVAAS